MELIGTRISRSIVESQANACRLSTTCPAEPAFTLSYPSKPRCVNDACSRPHGIRRRRRCLSARLHPRDAEVGWLACRNIRDAARVLAQQAAERAMLPGPGCETSRSQRFGFSARIG